MKSFSLYSFWTREEQLKNDVGHEAPFKNLGLWWDALDGLGLVCIKNKNNTGTVGSLQNLSMKT